MYITNVEVPGRDGASDVVGSRHGPWDKLKQAEWLDQFYRIALSKACIDGVMYSNFTDVADGIVPDSGLMTAELEPKESYLAMKRFHDRIFGR
jgi:hypothetical protein